MDQIANTDTASVTAAAPSDLNLTPSPKPLTETPAEKPVPNGYIPHNSDLSTPPVTPLETAVSFLSIFFLEYFLLSFLTVLF